LQTQSGELSSNLGQPELKNLPIAGLNPIELAFTVAGVQEQANRDNVTNGVGFSVNGTRPRANNFLIDGQDNNDNSIQGQAFLQTNEEAVREVTVLTNSYSAEFGRGGGSVTNVIYRAAQTNFMVPHGNSIATRHLPPFPPKVGSPASPQILLTTKTRLASPSAGPSRKTSFCLWHFSMGSRARERCRAD